MYADGRVAVLFIIHMYTFVSVYTLVGVNIVSIILVCWVVTIFCLFIVSHVCVANLKRNLYILADDSPVNF